MMNKDKKIHTTTLYTGLSLEEAVKLQLLGKINLDITEDDEGNFRVIQVINVESHIRPKLISVNGDTPFHSWEEWYDYLDNVEKTFKR